MTLIPEPDQQEFIGVEIYTTDGVFIKQLSLPRAGLVVPQHAHVYEHTSMLAAGSVRVWAGGKLIGDKVAPTGIVIAARVKHTFLSLEPNTVLYCIHNVDRTGEVDIAEEHSLAEAVTCLFQ